jgi:hypothetical protein
MISTIIVVLFPYYLQGQEVQKNHEFGVTFTSLENFGIRYKSGGNTLLRLSFLSLSGSKNESKTDSLTNTQNSIGFGFNIGFEKRKIITDKLNFYYGLELLTSYRYYSQNYASKTYNQKSSSWTLSPGLGFVLGLRYEINNDLSFSAEIVPSFQYLYTKDSLLKITTNGYTFGLNNSFANLTLAYRFGKNKS